MGAERNCGIDRLPIEITNLPSSNKEKKVNSKSFRPDSINYDQRGRKVIFNHEQQFETAEEFIDFFQKHSFFRTRGIYEANTIGRGGHIYRGQANANWELKPSVFRSHESLNNFTPQPPGKYDPEYKVRWLGHHLHAELRSVFIFLEAADKLGIETPIDYSRVKDHQELIYSAMNNQNYDYSVVFPNEKTL